MSPNLKTDARLVNELCDIDEGLTTWEVNFVESVARQVEAGRELSDGQREIGERIVEKFR